MLILIMAAILFSSPLQAAQAPPPDLHDLFRRHDWFALHAAGPLNSTSTLLAGAVESAFGDIASAERDLEATANADPNSSAAYVAHTILADTYVRAGQYQEALRETNLALAIQPSDRDAVNRRMILTALALSPDQSLVRSQPVKASIVRDGGALMLPVIFDGSPCQYLMDTGANFSTMSESEAKRLHLELRETEATVNDVLGRKVSVKVAVAQRLIVAGCELTNVGWLVTPDSQPPFNRLQSGRRGIIGLPVLFALGRIHWDRSGSLEVGGPSDPAPHGPNLCFEGLTPVTQIEVHDVKIPAMLDTGAIASALWPLFEQRFPEIMSGAKAGQSENVVGVAGTASVNVDVVPVLEVRIGGFATRFSPARVLRTLSRNVAKWEYGNIGSDLLNQARSVIIDFHNMTIALN